MGDLRKIAAFWHKDGKNGAYYSGTLDAAAVKSALVGDETRLLLFKVKNKRERGPDLELFAAPNERRDRETPSRPAGRHDAPERPQFDDPDDPIPF